MYYNVYDQPPGDIKIEADSLGSLDSGSSYKIIECNKIQNSGHM